VIRAANLSSWSSAIRPANRTVSTPSIIPVAVAVAVASDAQISASANVWRAFARSAIAARTFSYSGPTTVTIPVDGVLSDRRWATHTRLV